MSTKLFDVLIVYSSNLASSAHSGPSITTPFSYKSKNASYNMVYSYFLKACKNKNLSCAFTTSNDIVGPGKCSSYWQYKNGWTKIVTPCYSKLIFDKFSPTTKKLKNMRSLLFSSNSVKPFNPPKMFNLFFDKYKTYSKLKKYCIPTVILKGKTKLDVATAIKKILRLIKKSVAKTDFVDEVIVKDRYGAGGKRVYKVNIKNITKVVKIVQKSSRSFIIQPLISFDKGFRYGKTYAPTDIRLVYLGGKIFQTYIRVAKDGDFRCNEHAGGRLTYITRNTIPNNITLLANKISHTLGRQKTLYSLDFIVSNTKNIYLLEGNTGPGLDWDTTLPLNEIEAKKLIRRIVGEFNKTLNKKQILREKHSNRQSTTLNQHLCLQLDNSLKNSVLEKTELIGIYNKKTIKYTPYEKYF